MVKSMPGRGAVGAVGSRTGRTGRTGAAKRTKRTKLVKSARMGKLVKPVKLTKPKRRVAHKVLGKKRQTKPTKQAKQPKPAKQPKLAKQTKLAEQPKQAKHATRAKKPRIMPTKLTGGMMQYLTDAYTLPSSSVYIACVTRLLSVCLNKHDFEQMRVMRNTCYDDTTELQKQFEQADAPQRQEIIENFDQMAWQNRVCFLKYMLRRIAEFNLIKLDNYSLVSNSWFYDSAVKDMIMWLEKFLALIYQFRDRNEMKIENLAHEVALLVFKLDAKTIEEAQQQTQQLHALTENIAPKLEERLNVVLARHFGK